MPIHTHRHWRRPAQEGAGFGNNDLQITVQALHRIPLAQQSSFRDALSSYAVDSLLT